MKIHIVNIGCKVNYAEASQLKDIFSKRGHEIIESEFGADVVLVNTCTVTNKADADCRKTIRRAKKNSPDAFIGVFGCYAQLNPQEIEAIDGVDAVFGIKEKFSIPDLIDKLDKSNTTQIIVSDLENLHFDPAASYDNEARTRAFLKIQDGCDYTCSYCTIPKARGANRGIDFVDLPEKLEQLKASDYKEIVLTGINLGEYKSINGERFIDVLKLIENGNYGFRARISSIEPNLVSEQIIDLVKTSDSICNHFHIPLQSGSDIVLKMMKRRYNTSKFESLINEIKTNIPDCCIGADVICGFPGETDAMFDETFTFLQKLPLSYFHVFTYSVREGTEAADSKEQVPHIVRKERTNILRKLSEEKLSLFLKSQLGKALDFLPEKYIANKGTAVGHTDNYLNTELKCDFELENRFYKIRIDRVLKNKAIGILI